MTGSEQNVEAASSGEKSQKEFTAANKVFNIAELLENILLEYAEGEEGPECDLEEPAKALYT